LKQILDALPKGHERIGIISVIGEKAIYGDISADQDIASIQISTVLKSHIIESLIKDSEVSKKGR